MSKPDDFEIFDIPLWLADESEESNTVQYEAETAFMEWFINSEAFLKMDLQQKGSDSATELEDFGPIDFLLLPLADSVDAGVEDDALDPSFFADFQLDELPESEEVEEPFDFSLFSMGIFAETVVEDDA